MMRTLILIGAAVLALAACATEAVRLRNPRTGEIATCGPYYVDSIGDAQAQRERACIGDYQRQGYERAP